MLAGWLLFSHPSTKNIKGEGAGKRKTNHFHSFIPIRVSILPFFGERKFKERETSELEKRNSRVSLCLSVSRY